MQGSNLSCVYNNYTGDHFWAFYQTLRLLRDTCYITIVTHSSTSQVGGNVGVKADKSEKQALQIQDTFN